MSDASDYAPADDTLPGLPGLGEAPEGVSVLEAAARRSLQALADASLLNESHALPMALVLDLARSVGKAVAKGQGAAAAMAAAQLREAWQLLPDLDGAAAGGGDEWDKLARKLRADYDTERQRLAAARADR